MTSSYAAATADIVYDAREWQSLITAWLAKYLNADPAHIRVQQRTASGAYVLQFECQWRERYARDDYSTLAPSLHDELGHLVKIVAPDVSNRTICVGVLPISSKAAQKLHQRIDAKKNLLRTALASSPRYAWALTFFAALNVLVAGVWLHNHWHALDEPWHGVYEFVRYHALGEL